MYRPIGMAAHGNVIIGDENGNHLCYVAGADEASIVCESLNNYELLQSQVKALHQTLMEANKVLHLIEWHDTKLMEQIHQALSLTEPKGEDEIERARRLA